MSHIVPKFDRILIKREKITSKGSMIVIPDEVAKDNAPARGEVLAVEPTAGVFDNEGNPRETIKVGSRVIFAKYAGTYIKEDDDELYLIQDTDVLAEIID